MKMQENTFDIGWTNDFAHHVFGIRRHISVTNLHFKYASSNLPTMLACSNLGCKT